ncbi:MAG: hypothetical protein EBZ77_14775, partial [Chitinophagia bacterium]|nr:hypothetical protein [Chitinophagia bacterium]
MLWLFWLLAIVGSGVCGWLVYRADKKRGVAYPAITAGLRALVVVLVSILLFFPAFNYTRNVVEKPVIIHLQDNSASIQTALGSDSAAYRKETEALLNRLSAQYKVIRLGFGGSVRNDSLATYNLPATNISGALSHVQEYYGLDNIGAIILATDGQFNLGANPLYQQYALKGAVYSVAIGDSTAQKDMRISAIFANPTVSLNSSFEVRADVTAVLCDGYAGDIVLKEGNETLGTLPVRVNNNRFDRAVSFVVKGNKAGLHHYTISAPDAAGEKNTQNNRKDIFVEVTETRKRILIAYAAPHPDINAIKEGIAGIENYSVTTASADQIPANFHDFDAIVVHGLPTARMEIAGKLLAAGKPLWVIATSQTDIQAVNSLQDKYGFSIVPAPPHDVPVAYNTAFNL